jgi:hypothetical protein
MNWNPFKKERRIDNDTLLEVEITHKDNEDPKILFAYHPNLSVDQAIALLEGTINFLQTAKDNGKTFMTEINKP